jgi:soluble lytic murein transglycosylase
MPVAEIRQRLAVADHRFFAAVDLGTRKAEEALAIGPEAPFYLASVFDGIGRPEAAIVMLELAAERGPEPWRAEAAAMLAERLIADRAYERAETIARRAEAGAPKGSALAARTRRALVEALYWQKRDREVLQALPGLSRDAEVDLFRAVSTWRLGLDGATALFVELFAREPAAAVHTRAYGFLASDPSWLGRFTRSEQDLLAAKFSLAQGEWSAGIEKMEPVLEALDAARIADSALVFDLGNAYVTSAKTARGGAFLERLSRRLAGQARIDCLETAGRLYRRAKDSARALAALGSVATATRSSEQEDRARYYLLDVLLDLAPPDLPARIAAESKLWSVPSTFADLFGPRIASLAAARRWRTLASWYVALEENGPAETRAQLAYVLARALQDRLLSGGGPLGERTPRQLLEAARAASPTGYYGVAAACMLGELPEPIRSLAPVEGPARPPQAGSPQRLADTTRTALGPLVAGYFDYGLVAKAYALVWARREELSAGVLLDAARGLARAGDHRGSLNLTGWVARRRGLAAADLAVAYPRPYLDELSRVAADYEVDPWLLWGLVREESYFDADIVSSAGAVGLAQLMPDTAADLARQLRLEAPDLTDPATSLRMGTRHLAGLLGRVDAPVKALLAYNAGLARVRGWERTGAGLAPDLLVETVPFDESREYVRKIAVSALMYAWVYDGRDPRDTMRALFPLVPWADSRAPAVGPQ